MFTLFLILAGAQILATNIVVLHEETRTAKVKIYTAKPKVVAKKYYIVKP